MNHPPTAVGGVCRLWKGHETIHQLPLLGFLSLRGPPFCGKDLNHPPTAVGGIPQFERSAVCRKDLNHPTNCRWWDWLNVRFVYPSYSYLSTTIGSTRMARWAGIRQASSATKASKTTIMTNVSGSVGV